MYEGIITQAMWEGGERTDTALYSVPGTVEVL